MILTGYQLRTAVISEGDNDCRHYLNAATGEMSNDAPTGDSVLVDSASQITPDNSIDGSSYIIFSLKQLRKFHRSKLITAWLLVISSAACFFASTVGAMMKVMTETNTWATWLAPAAFFVLGMLWFPQCVNPTLKDFRGHWVNLRTGKSNLNGGCIIK